jgi:hypothetical protein
MNDRASGEKKTRRAELRLSPAEHEQFQIIADSAGITLSELIRRRLRGAKVVRRRDTTELLNELRRQGGLLKYLHTRGEPTLPQAHKILEAAERIEKFVQTLDDPEQEPV